MEQKNDQSMQSHHVTPSEHQEPQPIRVGPGLNRLDELFPSDLSSISNDSARDSMFSDDDQPSDDDHHSTASVETLLLSEHDYREDHSVNSLEFFDNRPLLTQAHAAYSFFNHSSTSLFGNTTRLNNTLSFQQMAYALVGIEQQFKEKNKQHSFNCFLINRNEHHDELLSLLGFLQENQDKLRVQRIQVIYLYEQHWSVMDIKNTDTGFSFILYDDANSLKYIIPTLITIQRFFPLSPLAYIGSNFQKDGYSCAFFALNAAKQLAKVGNLHTLLDAFEPQFDLANSINDLLQKPSELWLKEVPIEVLNALVTHLKYVSMLQWPEQLGSLVKMVQNRMLFTDYFEGKNYLRHNGKLLDDYWQDEYDEPKGIEAQKEKIRALIAKVEQDSDRYESRMNTVMNWQQFLIAETSTSCTFK